MVVHLCIVMLSHLDYCGVILCCHGFVLFCRPCHAFACLRVLSYLLTRWGDSILGITWSGGSATSHRMFLFVSSCEDRLRRCFLWIVAHSSSLVEDYCYLETLVVIVSLIFCNLVFGQVVSLYVYWEAMYWKRNVILCLGCFYQFPYDMRKCLLKWNYNVSFQSFNGVICYLHMASCDH